MQPLRRAAACFAALAAALLFAPGAVAVELRFPQADLHGFPRLSDEHGKPIADGELVQRKRGTRLLVHTTWRFHDGRVVVEDDVLETRPQLAQRSFRWVERRGGVELRRFEVDFKSHQAHARKLEGQEMKRWDETLDLEAGKAFAGYPLALAVSQLRSDLAAKDSKRDLTVVAFTPGPRAVTLEVSRKAGEHIQAAGRALPADLYTLHPNLPFPVSLVAHPPDSYLWFTRDAPPGLLRAEQNLAEKDDPRVRIDVLPSGPARPPAAPAARAPARPRR